MQQYREVKRKVKVNDTIMNLINKEVYQVYAVSADGFGIVRATALSIPKGKDGYGAYLSPLEYVVLEPIETDAPTIRGNVLTIGDKSIALFDEQMSALGLVTDAAQKRHEAMVELNERLWKFAMENGGCPKHDEESCTPFFDVYDAKWDISIEDKCFYIWETRYRSKHICRRAIDEIIIPYCKEHPELGL